jgi:uncharacterized repeat protein (TIGR01451 family)
MKLPQKKALNASAVQGAAFAVARASGQYGRGGQRLLLFAVAIALFWFGAAHARASLELKNEVFQEVEVKSADGKTERKIVPASRVLPGTEVQYVVTYVNKGEHTAGQVAITNPIPKELEYISAAGLGEVEVSVDGKTYGPLAALRVTDVDGKERAAKPSDVTHVRWRIASSLKPGEEGKVSFRARLK